MKSHNLSLGTFLSRLFTVPPRGESHSPSHTNTASIFLGGRADCSPQPVDIVNLMYHSRYSTPKAVRASITPSENKDRPDKRKMARWQLQQWAIGIVEDLIEAEASELSSLSGGLRLSPDVTWSFATGFSLTQLADTIRDKSPTLLRLTAAAAIPAADRIHPPTTLSPTATTAAATSEADQSSADGQAEDFPSASTSSPFFGESAPAGQGQNRRNPWFVSNLLWHVSAR